MGMVKGGMTKKRCTWFCTHLEVILPEGDEIKIFKGIKRKLRKEKIQYKLDKKPKGIPTITHGLTASETDKKTKIEYEITLGTLPSKEAMKNVLKNLIESRKKIEDRKKRDTAISFLQSSLKNDILPNLLKGKSSITIMFDISPSELPTFKSYFITKSFIENVKVFDILLAILDKYEFEDVKGSICSNFAFDIKSYTPIVNLPMPISLDEKLIKELGTPEVDGVNMKFKDSSLGIKKISIKKNKNEFNIKFRIDFVTTIFPDLLVEKYEYGSKVADLLVSEVEK